MTDRQGAAVPDGNNLVFESTALNLSRTGAFNYAVEFSADSHVEAGRREWISLNDLAKNSDGVVVVSPQWVRQCPTIAEERACKVGARVEEGGFRSGTLADITRRLADIPADVIYLLPFFLPGFADLHTGDDVRKGSLGRATWCATSIRLTPKWFRRWPTYIWRGWWRKGWCVWAKWMTWRLSPACRRRRRSGRLVARHWCNWSVAPSCGH